MIYFAAFMLLVAADFPLDEEFKSNVVDGECSLETSFKVTKAADTYVYLYSVKNKGKTKINVFWDVANKAMHYGHYSEMMIELAPGENANFILEHPDPPVYANGRVVAYHLTNRKNFEKMMEQSNDKNIKMQVPAKLLQGSGGYTNGALPKSYVDTPVKRR